MQKLGAIYRAAAGWAMQTVKQSYRWRVVLAFAFVTVAFTIQGAFLTRTINRSNHDRIVATQRVHRERILSCKRTYEGVRKVFTPFFRPARVRTRKERHDIAKFNRIVDRLKSGCDKQITTKGTS